MMTQHLDLAGGKHQQHVAFSRGSEKRNLGIRETEASLLSWKERR